MPTEISELFELLPRGQKNTRMLLLRHLLLLKELFKLGLTVCVFKTKTFAIQESTAPRLNFWTSTGSEQTNVLNYSASCEQVSLTLDRHGDVQSGGSHQRHVCP